MGGFSGQPPRDQADTPPRLGRPPGTKQTPPPPRPGRPPAPQTRQTSPLAGRTHPRTRQTPQQGEPPQTRQTPPPRPGRHPREEDCSIRSMSGQYASYWNAFLWSLWTAAQKVRSIFSQVSACLWGRGVLMSLSVIDSTYPWIAPPTWTARTAAPSPDNTAPTGQHYPLDSTSPWTLPPLDMTSPPRKHHPGQFPPPGQHLPTRQHHHPHWTSPPRPPDSSTHTPQQHPPWTAPPSGQYHLLDSTTWTTSGWYVSYWNAFL